VSGSNFEADILSHNLPNLIDLLSDSCSLYNCKCTLYISVVNMLLRHTVLFTCICLLEFER
jgi:hypothetical protein